MYFATNRTRYKVFCKTQFSFKLGSFVPTQRILTYFVLGSITVPLSSSFTVKSVYYYNIGNKAIESTPVKQEASLQAHKASQNCVTYLGRYRDHSNISSASQIEITSSNYRQNRGRVFVPVFVQVQSPSLPFSHDTKIIFTTFAKISDPFLNQLYLLVAQNNIPLLVV